MCICRRDDRAPFTKAWQVSDTQHAKQDHWFPTLTGTTFDPLAQLTALLLGPWWAKPIAALGALSLHHTGERLPRFGVDGAC
jgi:hypothetical protein